MSLEWSSQDTEIFLNPRIPSKEKAWYLSQLQGCALKGHVWVATSGTTNRFKFVALSKEAILASAAAVNTYLSSNASDIWLHTLPDFHVGGLAIWARSYLSGAEIVKTPSWNPTAFVDLANKKRATLTSLVPTQVYDLVTRALPAPSTLRKVIVGGGALNETLFNQAKQLGWNLLPSYGLTESASLVAAADDKAFDLATVLPHVELKIDADGFIYLKGASLLTTYGVVDEQSVKLVDPKENGWLKTGDQGEWSGECLRVLGRFGDFVKISGESVNVLHLQNVLDMCAYALNIQRSAVIAALPHQRLGYAIHLVIEGKQKMSRLIDKFNERVLPYEKIQKIHYLEKIPRTSLGKLEKDVLIKLLEQRSGHS